MGKICQDVPHAPTFPFVLLMGRKYYWEHLQALGTSALFFFFFFFLLFTLLKDSSEVVPLHVLIVAGKQ